MPFILLSSEGEDQEFEYLSDEINHTCTCQVGYDEERDFTYSAMACLVPLAGGGAGEFELIFTIVEYDHEFNSDHEYFDGLETRYKIASEYDREFCRGIILMCIEALIVRVNPEVVTMFTFADNLPEKALTKYEQICELFRENGFDARKSDPFGGVQSWAMRKLHE